MKRGTLIVYQAPWEWEFLWNRSQPFARALSKYATVVYVNYGSRYARAEGIVQKFLERIGGGVLIEMEENVYLYRWLGKRFSLPGKADRSVWDYRFLRFALNKLLGTHDKVWLLTSRPITRQMTTLWRWDKVVVDIEDPWLSLNWPEESREAIEGLLQNADAVFSNGDKIAQDYQKWCPARVDSLPNGIEEEFFHSLLFGGLSCPDLFTQDSAGRRALYTGNINDRFDFERLEEIVRKTSFEFFFIGAENVPAESRTLWQQIKKYPTVHYAPPVEHRKIANFLTHADALLLPFRSNGLEGMFPAKLFEYLAAAKPILSFVPLPAEIGQAPSFFHCPSLEDFIRQLNAIAEKKFVLDAEEIQYCRQLACENTWEKRAAQFMDKVNGS